MKALALVVATVLCAGCSSGEQPAQGQPPTQSPVVATTTSPNLPTSVSTAAATTAGAFDWTKRVGPIEYTELPKDSRGDWSARAVLEDGSIVMSLTENRPLSDAEKSSFSYDLVRFDPRTSERRVLTHMPPGSQALFPTAAKGGLAWVEVTDLRAFGWKLHLTNLNDGSDKVVSTDPGIHPPGSQTVIPKIAFDGTTLVYTVLAQVAGGEAVTDVRAVGQQAERTIASVPAKSVVISISIDDQSIAWIEDTGQLDPAKTATVGMYDRVTNSFARIATSMTSNVYAIGLPSKQMLFGTGVGVFASNRTISNLKKLSPEGSSVTQLVVMGNYLVYRTDQTQTAAAIDLTTGEHSQLASGATDGPYVSVGRAIWFERPTGTRPGRVAMVRL